jgi:hypothetical protein
MRLSFFAAVLAVTAGLGCSSGVGENDYTCNGVCEGEPMSPQVIQAPDDQTACTEFLESCRGSGYCSSCS